MTDARTKEAIRYLGYGRHAVDDHTLKLVESCFEELSQAACGRIVYRIFELEFPEIFHRRYGKSGNTSGVCGCYAGRISG